MGIEQPISKMGKQYIERAKNYISVIYPEDLQPNWSDVQTITTGIAKGATNYNIVVWQGQQYWLIGEANI